MSAQKKHGAGCKLTTAEEKAAIHRPIQLGHRRALILLKAIYRLPQRCILHRTRSGSEATHGPRVPPVPLLPRPRPVVSRSLKNAPGEADIMAGAVPVVMCRCCRAPPC